LKARFNQSGSGRAQSRTGRTFDSPALDADGLAVGDASLDADILAVGDASLVADVLAEGDASLDTDVLAVGDASLDADGLAVGDASLDADGLAVGDASLDADGLAVGDASLDADGLAVGDASLLVLHHRSLDGAHADFVFIDRTVGSSELGVDTGALDMTMLVVEATLLQRPLLVLTIADVLAMVDASLNAHVLAVGDVSLDVLLDRSLVGADGGFVSIDRTVGTRGGLRSSELGVDTGALDETTLFVEGTLLQRPLLLTITDVLVVGDVSLDVLLNSWLL
jgi:hypothetical protein